jgi:hypothetical protein
MSINADNIIGTYDIYTKQYIVTFTEKPTLVVPPADCSFSLTATEVVEIIPIPEPTDQDCSFSLAAVYSGPARTATISGLTTSNINTNVTLTAVSNNFTSYKHEWTGGNVDGDTTEVVTATSSSAGTVNYGVTINDVYSDTHSINWTNPPTPPTPTPTPPPTPPPTPTPCTSRITSTSIPAQTLTQGQTVNIDVSPYFTQLDGLSLSYNADGSGAIFQGLLSSVSISGSTVTITANNSNVCNTQSNAVSVTADDGVSGNCIGIEFISVTVTGCSTPPTPPPTPPTPPPTPPTPPPSPPTPTPTPSGSFSGCPVTSFTPGVSGSTSITVVANEAWSLSIAGAASSYFTLSPASGSATNGTSVTVSYDGSSSFDRDAIISLTVGGTNVASCTIEYSN